MKLTTPIRLLVVATCSCCLLVGPLDGYPTPENIRDIFVGRCWEYQQVVHPGWIATPKNCTDLWNTFEAAFAFRDACDVHNNSYDEFLAAASHDIDTRDKVMYWSGSVVPLVYDYTNDARQWLTIRDYLPGYIMKNVDDWCGQNDSKSGMNFVQCPTWYTCPGYPINMSASQAFWRSLSADFARFVQGGVHVLLNGSNGQAFREQSTFTEMELANLEASRNPVLHVWLIHDVDPEVIRETCEDGTLLLLKAEVERKGMLYNCTDDPPEMMHFQCSEYVTADKCRFAGGPQSTVSSFSSASFGASRVGVDAFATVVFIQAVIIAIERIIKLI